MEIGRWLSTACMAGMNGRAAKRQVQPIVLPDDYLDLGESWPLDVFPHGGGKPMVVSLATLKRHVYVLGATGSGKTNLLVQMIDADVREGRSVALIDLRGDLVERVLNRLAKAGVDPDRVCLIDFRDDSRIIPINPLGGGGDAHSRAFHVLAILKHQAESWGVQLEETLRNCLVALAEARRTLVELESFLLDPGFRQAILAVVTDPYVQTFFARFDALSPERQLTWAMPVLNKVTPLLAMPRIRATLSHSEGLEVGMVLNTPGSILLVSLAVDRFHGASHLIGGLMVSAIEDAVMARLSIPESRRNSVALYVDEFETMASDAFLSLLAEGRRFGLSLVLSHQNLIQLDSKLRAGLQNNAHIHFYFQTGATDAADIAREVDSPLVRDEVKSLLMRLHPGQAILVRRGSEAVVVKTALSRDGGVSVRATQPYRDGVARWIPKRRASPVPQPTVVNMTANAQSTWQVRDGI